MAIQAYCGQVADWYRGVIDRNPQTIRNLTIGYFAIGISAVAFKCIVYKEHIELVQRNPKWMTNAVVMATGVTAGIVGVGIVAGALFVTLRSLAGNETYESGVQWLREKTENYPKTSFLITTGIVMATTVATLKYTVGNVFAFAKQNREITRLSAGAFLLMGGLIAVAWKGMIGENDPSVAFLESGFRLLCWVGVMVISASVISVAAVAMRKEVIGKWVQRNPTIGCASLLLPFIAVPAVSIALICLIQKVVRRAVERQV